MVEALQKNAPNDTPIIPIPPGAESGCDAIHSIASCKKKIIY